MGSFNVKKRLEQMDFCGLNNSTLHKSLQIQDQVNKKLGLSQKIIGLNSRYKTKQLLEQTGYLNRKDDNISASMTGDNEMEKLEEMARIQGTINRKPPNRRNQGKK